MLCQACADRPATYEFGTPPPTSRSYFVCDDCIEVLLKANHFLMTLNLPPDELYNVGGFDRMDPPEPEPEDIDDIVEKARDRAFSVAFESE